MQELQTTENIEEYDLEMEAAVQKNIEDKRAHWHIPYHGNMKEDRPNGVFRLLGGQLNSAATARTSNRCITDLDRIIKKWDVQGGGFLEVGMNWSCLPRTQQLDSWFQASHEEVRTSTAHNKNENESIGQPGGIGLFACKELMQYICSSSSNTRKLGRWNSWSVYADSNHRTRIVVAYQVSVNKSDKKTIYCQHKRHILEKGLGIKLETRELFQKDLLRAILEWQAQGEQIIVFIDMNKHVLTGTLAQEFFRLGMVEATHTQWHGEEPHTYIDGSAPIDGVYHSPNLEVTAIAQLSFHEGVSNHCMVLVDVTTRLAIGQQEFRVVRLLAWKLSTKNKASTKTYLKRMVMEFERHKLVNRQHGIIAELGKGLITAHIQEAMETLDVQKTEIQRSCES